MKTISTYAVIDRAIESSIIETCERLDCDYWCLFPEPVDEEFALLAPYLVKINEDLNKWLLPKAIPWGFIFESSEAPNVLRGHLRTLLDVEIKETKQRLFLRFYDPRILWSLLNAFEPLMLNHFLGPMLSIKTVFPNQAQSDFEQLVAYRPFGYVTYRPFPLLQIQYQQVLEQCRRNLITEVTQILKQDSDTFSEQLIGHLIDWDIAQPKQIKCIAALCVEQQVTEWTQFPVQWARFLSHTESPSDYRVNSLLNEVRTTYVL
ncbi:DUF4123 domain-containing protein [Vibrio scophthalmi]|uniref:DUF4123 domain-containing protein n=1 Tax=Vibrio scophthalmi TaxID=45658 RepID=A0A1E3WLG0_9VIBR|nr:DUF4123 domain-containing protein [Vibrio scophthalmi]ODS10603.1 hypothetical protein VSF3289_00862 [Vibrio scophthalmi]